MSNEKREWLNRLTELINNVSVKNQISASLTAVLAFIGEVWIKSKYDFDVPFTLIVLLSWLGAILLDIKDEYHIQHPPKNTE